MHSGGAIHSLNHGTICPITNFSHCANFWLLMQLSEVFYFRQMSISFISIKN